MKEHKLNPKTKEKLKVVIILVLVVAAASLALPEAYYYQYHPLDTPPKSLGYFSLVSDHVIESNGKIVILYIGAEACPFCAAESWSIVEALQAFGTFEGLTQSVSNATDGIPSVPGYSFVNASLISSSITFWEIEETGSSWTQTLQTPNSTEDSLFKLYDRNGSIPFLLIGGVYLLLGSEVSPLPMANMNWTACHNQVLSSSSIGSNVRAEKVNIISTISYVIGHLSEFKGARESEVSIREYLPMTPENKTFWHNNFNFSFLRYFEIKV